MADYKMVNKYISLKTIMESPMRQFVRIHTGETEPEDWVISGANIMRIPAADVRPVVKAIWEDETGYIFSDLAQRVHCPACKSYAYFYPITTKNFCPNCGADMRPERRADNGK